jgi:hypothetical protein
MPSIFISFSTSDGGDIAKHVYEDYKEKGYDVFYSPREIPYGHKWREEIKRHIEECDLFLIIATHGAINSKEVAKEIDEAKRLGKHIIPCRHDDIKWSDLEKLGIDSSQGLEFDSKEDLIRKLSKRFDDSTLTQGSDEDTQQAKSIPSRRSIKKGRIWIIIAGAVIGAILIYIVQDTMAPSISVPSLPMRVKTTSLSGAGVDYTDKITAKDNRGDTITPQCTPPSGFTFPIGNTEVTCTATDKAGNRAEEKRFIITVVSLIPLRLYYSDTRQDNFLIATDQKNLPPDKYPGYFFVRTEGYIYRNQQADENLIPLNLYYSDTRQEFFTVATEEGISDAERAGYRLIGTEGFVYPADYFPVQ